MWLTDVKFEVSRHPELMVAGCYCGRRRQKFGLVIARIEDDAFEICHSFLLGDCYPKTELGGRTNGGLSLSKSYNGCKFCNNGEIFQCGKCDELNCQGQREGNKVVCGKCGNRAGLGGYIESFSTKHD